MAGLERAPCGYLTTDGDGTILEVNEAFLTLTGYERSQLVGRRTFSELLTTGGRIYHETHYAPMLQMQGAAREIALDVVGAGGERLPVLVNSVVDDAGGGAPPVIRTAVFEATHRRRYERELLAAKQRAEESERRAMALARTLQRTLIPPAPPPVDGLDITATYRPAGAGDEVGGDFYDVFELGDGDWVVAVGDVRGKGVDAAVVTALVRHTIRAAAVRHTDPSDVLRTVNDALLRDPTERFCTVALLRLRRRGGGWTARSACGGHPLPVAFADGAPAALVGRPGTLLGVLPELRLHDEVLDLAPGGGVVLYTDGVTEARRDGELFGEDRLLAAVDRHRSAPRFSDALVHEVLEFQGTVTADDIVVVGIRSPVST